MKIEVTQKDIDYYGAEQIALQLKAIAQTFAKNPVPIESVYSIYGTSSE